MNRTTQLLRVHLNGHCYASSLKFLELAAQERNRCAGGNTKAFVSEGKTAAPDGLAVLVFATRPYQLPCLEDPNLMCVADCSRLRRDPVAKRVGVKRNQAQRLAGSRGHFNLATANEFVTAAAKAPVVQRFPFSKRIQLAQKD